MGILSAMDITLTTAGLLFPAVSLRMPAYTNRFLTLATIIRSSQDRYHASRDEDLLGQIENLRYRVYLIRNMQIYAVLSLIFCVVSMLSLFAGWIAGGQWSFAIAMILMVISLRISLRQLRISGGALDLLLKDMEQHEKLG
jgi:hypothetical protein